MSGSLQGERFALALAVAEDSVSEGADGGAGAVVILGVVVLPPYLLGAAMRGLAGVERHSEGG